MDVEELKQKNKHNWKLKIGILGISLFLQVAGSNLAAISRISQLHPFRHYLRSLRLLLCYSFFLVMLLLNGLVKGIQ